MREAHFREGAGETEAVQESKAKRNQPRIILRYVASLGWVAQQFACEEYDAKGNRCLDHRTMTKPRVAAARVMEWATVKAVTVARSMRTSLTSSTRQSTKRRGSTPLNMCSTPSWK